MKLHRSNQAMAQERAQRLQEPADYWGLFLYKKKIHALHTTEKEERKRK